MLLKSYAFTTVAGLGTGLNAVLGSAAVILRPSRWLWDTGVIALLASYIPA